MIISCGEALIDMLPRKLESGEDVFLPVAGGAVFNTAITLGRLSEPCGFVSGISTDLFGEQLMSALEASKVDTSFCVRSEQPTTLAFVRLSDGQAQYTFMDENSAGRTLSREDLPVLPEGVEALHFGAISLIGEPCGSAYETLMHAWHEKAVMSLDPNIRPGFITNPQRHRERIQRMIAMADIVKVSDEDLDWIAPGRPHPQAIGEMISDRGVQLVVLTKGRDGVSVFTQNGMLEVAAQEVEVVDTIGAGDSFNGGFLAGLRRSGLLSKAALANVEPQALRPAVELAAKVAAITVSRAGANPPWQSEL